MTDYVDLYVIVKIVGVLKIQCKMGRIRKESKMKFLAGILVGLCVIGLANIQPPTNTDIDGDAADLTGEHCWTFSSTTDGTPVLGTLRLGIMNIGHDHYLCSGIMTVTEPLSVHFTAFGNMEFVDDEIRCTLSVQGKRFENGNYTVGIDMLTVTIDPNTLNGTSEGIGIYYDAIEFSRGTFTHIGSELPVDPNL